MQTAVIDYSMQYQFCAEFKEQTSGWKLAKQN